MRVADGIICSTVVHRPPLPLVQPRAPGSAATASTSSATSWPQPGPLRASRSAGPAASATRHRWPAGSPRCATSCARAPTRASCPVGHPAAAAFVEEFGRERAVAYPSAEIEVYPASMTLFDVSIAPSAENNQFRGKSDLRWLEASAVGIPLVAHPDVYPDIEDGVTGVHARDAGGGRGGAAAADRQPRGARADRRRRARARRDAPPHRGRGRELARGPQRGRGARGRDADQKFRYRSV